MRYKLRTLLIVLALGPALIAVGWRAWQLEPVLVAWWVDRSRLSLESRSQQVKLAKMAKDIADRDEAFRIYERAIEQQQQILAR